MGRLGCRRGGRRGSAFLQVLSGYMSHSCWKSQGAGACARHGSGRGHSQKPALSWVLVVLIRASWVCLLNLEKSETCQRPRNACVGSLHPLVLGAASTEVGSCASSGEWCLQQFPCSFILEISLCFVPLLFLAGFKGREYGKNSTHPPSLNRSPQTTLVILFFKIIICKKDSSFFWCTDL